MQNSFATLALALAVSVSAGATASQPITVANDEVITNGDLVIRDNQPEVRTRLDSASGDWFGFDEEGRRVIHMDQGGANLFLGGNGSNDDGDVVLFSETANDQNTNNSSIHLDGGQGAIRLGGGGETGQMVLRNPTGDQRIFFDGGEGLAVIGNTGQHGRFEVRNGAGTATAEIDGAAGRLRANQIVSRQAGQGGSEGIDSASFYLDSRNPAIGLRDRTGGNSEGWYVQSSSNGRLVFNAGDTNGLGNRVFVLSQDGSVCLGNCN